MNTVALLLLYLARWTTYGMAWSMGRLTDLLDRLNSRIERSIVARESRP